MVVVLVHAQPTGGPIVVGTAPAAGTWQGIPTQLITIDFNEPVTGLSPESVRVVGSLTGARSGSMLGSGTSGLSYLPSQAFLPGERVELTVGSSLTGISSNNPANPKSWSYHTAAGINPGQFGPAQAFGLAPSLPGRTLVAGDLNRDGFLDILEASNGTGLSIYAGSSTGLSAAYTIDPLANETSRPILLDFNADGWLDIFEARPTGNRLWEADTIGGFLPSPGFTSAMGSSAAASADLNGNGWQDIIVAGSTGIYVFWNNGTGGFPNIPEQISSESAVAIGVGNLDGEGLNDIVALGNSIRVFLNAGAGQFTPQTPFGNGLYSALAVRDMNRNGLDDLVVVGPLPPSGPVATAVWLSNGNGSFTKHNCPFSGVPAVAIAIGDLDGDGDPDAVTGSTSAPAIQVWRNNGTGYLTSAGTGIGGGPSTSVALGDFSGDGALDLLDGKQTGSASLHHYVPHDADVSLSLSPLPISTIYESVSTTSKVVLAINLTDGGTQDSLPSVIQGFSIDLSGATADASEAAWTLSGVGLSNTLAVVTGPVGNQRLEFSGLSVAVPDGSSVTLSLRVVIPPNPVSIPDGSHFPISLDPATIRVSHLGSQINPLTVPVSVPGFTYQIIATRLTVLQQPPVMLAINQPFDMVVAYTDIHGGIDLNVNNDIATAIRSTSSSSTLVGVSTPAVQGVAYFTGANQLSIAGPGGIGLRLNLVDDGSGSVAGIQPTLTEPFSLFEPGADLLLQPFGTNASFIPSIAQNSRLALGFRVTDQGLPGTDGATIEAVTVSLNGSNADANDATWTLHTDGLPPIAGTVNGTVPNQTLDFSGFTAPIANAGLREFELRVSLSSPVAQTLDNSSWKLSLATNGITLAAGSSHFAANQAVVNNGGGIEFRVAATRLTILTQPRPVESVSDPFIVRVAYTDVHGNIDRDVVGDLITVMRTDNGAVDQPVSAPASSGIANFTDQNRIILGMPGSGTTNISLILADNTGGTVNLSSSSVYSDPFELSEYSACDVNFDSQINVVDVQHTVLLILDPNTSEFPGEGDANRDTLINVVDIQTIVNRILSNP